MSEQKPKNMAKEVRVGKISAKSKRLDRGRKKKRKRREVRKSHGEDKGATERAQ